MAITSASGGFNGNFSPIIYSKTAQIALRKAAVTNAITNNSYFGEIANQGDVVRIQKEPDVTVNALERHTAISVEKLNDEDFSLTIDKANYFAFKMDDIEDQFANVDYVSLAADRAAYKMADSMDADVLSYLSGHTTAGAFITTTSGDAQHDTAGNLTGEFLTANHLDATDFGNLTIAATATAGDSVPLAPRLPGATALSATTVSPLTVVARMARKMDTQNVDSRGRWLVVDPVFIEMLKDEDSRVLNADFGGSGLMNGLVLNNLHGFRVYVSNNLPAAGTGSGTSGTSAQSTNYGVIVAGQEEAVASAEQINKVENYRDPDSFADIVRGMHLYGRKILRPEALITARYNAA
ncbi:putative coat protein [Roseobacter phage CRP-2]|nr:putative coat protein [Roseobacter phage CRP-2]